MRTELGKSRWKRGRERRRRRFAFPSSCSAPLLVPHFPFAPSSVTISSSTLHIVVRLRPLARKQLKRVDWWATTDGVERN